MVMARYRLLLLSLCTAIGLMGLTGCADDDNSSAAVKQVLKVLDSNEWSFNTNYGDYVNAAFPNVEVQVIPSSSAMDYKLSSAERLKRMKALIESEQPDLIMLSDDSMYTALADEGLLGDLSFYLAQNKELEQHIHPGILEQMRYNRDGALYALTPDLQAQLLFYNADLFNRLGIEPPHDGMTWAEILQLAQRVTQSSSSLDERAIGFLPVFPGPSGLASSIGITEQLGLYPYRAASGTMTVNMPAWQRVYQTAVEAYRNGTFALNDAVGDDGSQLLASTGDSGQTDLFTEGRAGMVVGNYFAYQDVPFKLGAVGPPVDEATRTRSFSVYPGFTMSIRAGSSMAQLSWDVIAFIMGDYVAKVRSGLAGSYDKAAIPSNMTYAEYAKDPIIKSIYQQMPSHFPSDNGTILGSAYGEMADMLSREVDAAVSNKQTFDQMIERMQKQGQEILDRELKKQ
ncbi:multiple sugar transport system substrate-binding protein [Paenibacillus cellulosilyticus]|uniref:Multiple sugar transport system substrate-binding protein n=2 Tax=Paenibacillus cellulosilyticus TaxID=375489 RepID=A0A2V2YN80_9BACL|nr:multiple sugar transport system substrate-binding protein [Paenibacillus cellulosilyticus]